MPEWVGSLKHLVKIHLKWSYLKKDEFTEVLGKLPKLMLLSLDDKAYEGEKLVFGAEAFLNLRQLCIYVLLRLKEVRFQKGAFPQLETIEITWCQLGSGIIGINHLPVLKQISLGYNGKVARLAMLQAEVDTHPSNPVVQLKQDRSQHDLGDGVRESVVVETEDEEEPSLLLETCMGGERAQSEAAAMPTTNVISHDDLMYTYNSC
ncbi:hypothetical protein VPH35_134227 [Triticum aestivum]